MENEQNQRKIGLFTATCLIIGNMIGLGIFTSLGFQIDNISSGFTLLFLWVIGGIFSLSGALCYGELAAMMPYSGGEYYYLSKIYHPLLGFLSGWLSITVGFAAPNAASAIALGNYLNRLIDVNPTIIALSTVIIISLIHAYNKQTQASFQGTSTSLQLILIIVFIVAGLILGKSQLVNFMPDTEGIKMIFSSPFAISLVYVAYAYAGWNTSVYIAGEIKNPEKNLPLSLIIGTVIVMILYLLLNFVFLYTTPMEAMKGQLDIGYISAEFIFGKTGAVFITIAISCGLIAGISSRIWAAPQVMQAIGEDIPLFGKIAKNNNKGIPIYGILTQLAIIIILIITSSFQAVITYISFTLTLSSFMTVLGVIIYRFQHSAIQRPYQTWFYPVTPIIFLSISLWMLVFIFLNKPWESLAGLSTICLGIPVYFLTSNMQKS